MVSTLSWQDLEIARTEADRALLKLRESQEEIESLQNYNNILAKQSVNDRDEISTLNSRVVSLIEANDRTTGQVEDLTKRLSEIRKSSEVLILAPIFRLYPQITTALLILSS